MLDVQGCLHVPFCLFDNTITQSSSIDSQCAVTSFFCVFRCTGCIRTIPKDLLDAALRQGDLHGLD